MALAARLLAGDFAVCSDSLHYPVVCVFFVCTATEFSRERQELQRRGLALREYARRHGVDLCILDLWGDPTQVDNGMSPSSIADLHQRRCQALRKTQRDSALLNTVILTGHKYGETVLPSRLSAAEFDTLYAHMATPEDRVLLSDAFCHDDSCRPPGYVLSDLLNIPLQPLRTILQNAATVSLTPCPDAVDSTPVNYVPSLAALRMSALEAEVRCALDDPVNPSRPSRSVLWFQRTFTDIEDFTADPAIAQFADAMTSTLLSVLQAELQQTLCKRHAYELNYAPTRGLDVEERETHQAYLTNFFSDLELHIKQAITSTAGVVDDFPSPLILEISYHLEYAASQAAAFTGRQAVLATLHEYLLIRSEDQHDDAPVSYITPFALYGVAGAGKSSVLAKAVQQLTQAVRGDDPQEGPVVVVRFLSRTPSSSTARGLLQGLCAQIAQAYSQPWEPVESYAKLVALLPGQLTLASERRPLFIFLDGLDRLKDDDAGRDLHWLPSHLPTHVRVVVSTIPDSAVGCLPALHKLLADVTCIVELQDMADDHEANEMLDKWLLQLQRTLTAAQRQLVLFSFQSCRLPLYLWLCLVETTRQTRNCSRLPAAFPPSVNELLHTIFRSLEREFPPSIFAHIVCYLSCATNGLSLCELEDILSCDEVVLSALWDIGPQPAIRRFPTSTLHRVITELGPLLMEHVQERSRLLVWHHPIIRAGALDQYAPKYEQQAVFHSALADFFLGKWSGETAKPFEYMDAATKASCTAAQVRYVLSQPLSFSTDDQLTNFDRMASPLSHPGNAPSSLPVRDYCDLDTSILNPQQPVCFNLRKLAELPHHLLASGRFEEAVKSCLGNFSFMMAKIRAVGLADLLADFYSVPETAAVRTELRHVQEALLLSASIVAKQPEQLAAQLLGRLENRAARSPLLKQLYRHARDACSIDSGVRLAPARQCLSGVGGTLLFTVKGSSDPVLAVAMDAHGQQVISSYRNEALVWDVNTGLEIRRLRGHMDKIMALCVAPDRNVVLTAGLDRKIREWDLSSGNLLQTLTGHTKAVKCLALTEDGEVMVSGSADTSVRVWLHEVDKGWELTQTLKHDTCVHAVAFSPEQEKLLVGCDDATLAIWELATGELHRILIGHAAAVLCVAVTANGKYVLTGSADATVKVWDMGSGMDLRTIIGHTGAVRCLSLTPDSRLVVTGSTDRSGKIFDILSGRELYSLLGHTEPVAALAISVDGLLAVTASEDKTAKVWDLTAHMNQQSGWLGTAASLRAVTTTPDGRYTITASSANAVRIWDMASFKVTATLRGHTGWVTCLLITRSAREVLTGSGDSTLRLWKFLDKSGGGCAKVFLGHTAPVLCLAVAHSMDLAASGSEDRTVRFWDLSTGTGTSTKEVKEFARVDGFQGRVMSLVITPDDAKLIAGCEDGEISLWHLETRQLIQKLLQHTQPVSCLALNSNGRQLFSGSWDGTIQTWDVEAGQAEAVLFKYNAPVLGLSSSLGDAFLVSAAGDHTICIFDMFDGILLDTFTMDSAVLCCETAVVPDTAKRHGSRNNNSLYGQPTSSYCVIAGALSGELAILDLVGKGFELVAANISAMAEDANGDFVNVWDRIMVDDEKRAVVRYIGDLKYQEGEWVGLQFDDPIGEHDGTIGNRTYFRCKRGHGTFVRHGRVRRMTAEEMLAIKPLRTMVNASNSPHASPTSSPLLGRRYSTKHHQPQQQQQTPLSTIKISRAMFSGSPPRDSPSASPLLRKRHSSKNLQHESSSSSLEAVALPKFPQMLQKVVVITTGVVGTVQFFGSVRFAAGQWVGIKLASPDGTCNGTVDGTKYFGCKQNHGIFAPLADVRVATTEEAVQHDIVLSHLRRTSSKCKAPPVESSVVASSFPSILSLRDAVHLDGRAAVVCYLGPVLGSEGDFVGLELDEPTGEHDGTIGNRTYFQCKPMHGVFVRAHELEVAARTSVSSATPTVSGTSSSPSVKNWQRLAQNATRSSSPLHSTNSERSSSSPLTDSRNRASSRTGMIAGSIKVDVVVGDKVFFDGTKSATVRYIGEVHFAAGVWYGLQLLDGGGKHDGTLNGKTYFRCKAMHGVFVRRERFSAGDAGTSSDAP